MRSIKIITILAVATVLGTGANGCPFQKEKDNRTGSSIHISVNKVVAYEHALAIRPDGTLWAWGSNGFAQLGLGSSDNNPHPMPTQVGTSTWKDVAAGGAFSVAIRADGTLWAWGVNQLGQLGIGYASHSWTGIPPTQIGIDNNWDKIIAANGHTLAIKTDGSLWAWGDNRHGQLCLGDTTDRLSPVQVGSDNNWAMIAPGLLFTLALKSDGTLWGSGSLLGISNPTTPTGISQIGTDTNWRFIAAPNAGDFAVAIKTDGTLWAWGNNVAGQLGLGNTASRDTPTKVGTDTDWQACACGNYYTIAIKNNDTIWAWGDNSAGQLGTGDTMNRTLPTQAGTDTDWQMVTAGGYYSLAIRRDNTMWSWGYNSLGQLGLGNLNTILRP